MELTTVVVTMLEEKLVSSTAQAMKKSTSPVAGRAFATGARISLSIGYPIGSVVM